MALNNLSPGGYLFPPVLTLKTALYIFQCYVQLGRSAHLDLQSNKHERSYSIV